MPPQTIALAFAASIYPPAVAAIIALGRGEQLRSRVLAFVVAAAVTTYAVGAAMLFAFEGIGAARKRDLSLSSGIYIGLGVLLMLLAVRLQRRRGRGSRDAADKRPSKIERYLRSRRLAFVLGVTLYALPSPIYAGAVMSIDNADLSTGSELLALAVAVAVMLWLIEIPMLMLLIYPAPAGDALDRTNRWFSRNGRTIAVVFSAAAGAYLVIKGVSDLGS